MGTDTFNNYTAPTGYAAIVGNNGDGTYDYEIITGGTMTLNGVVSPGSTSIQDTNQYIGNGSTYTTYSGNAIGDGAGYIIVYMPTEGAGGTYFVVSSNPVTFGTVFTPDSSFGNFNPVCFATGTLIRTTRGDVPVQALRAGDRAVTASGACRPITWVGHRDLDTEFLAAHPESRPVRILAGAFGGGLPTRTLVLSPGHPVLVGADANHEGGVLVPIMCLINGTSIARASLKSVTYWHVELDTHDILLAEGLPAESFLDYGTRSWFENGADHALTNPDHVAPGLGARCRPVAIDGDVVDAERRRLDTLFALRLTADSHWPRPDSVSAGLPL